MVDLDGLSLKELGRLDAVLRLAVDQVEAAGEGAVASIRLSDYGMSLWAFPPDVALARLSRILDEERAEQLRLIKGMQAEVLCPRDGFGDPIADVPDFTRQPLTEYVEFDPVDIAGPRPVLPQHHAIDAAADVLPPDPPPSDPVANPGAVTVDPPAAAVPAPPQGVDPWPDSPLAQRLKALDRRVWTVEADHAVIEAKMMKLPPDEVVATLRDCGLRLKDPMAAARARVELLRGDANLRDVLAVLTAVIAAESGE